MPLLALVPAFVFISGYYGITFRLSKLVRLYTIGLVCSIITVAVPWLLGMDEGLTIRSWWFVYTRSFWFLHAYALLMLLSPLVDKSLDVKKGFPILLLVFGWIACASLNHVGKWLPQSPGVAAYSGLTLFGVYVAARLCRKYGIIDKINRTWAIAALPLLWFLAAIGFSNYASFICLLLAMELFVFGRKLNLGAFATWLAPSTFAIYLIHSNEHFFVLMRWFENAVVAAGCPILAAYLLVATVTFAVCAILDIPRRLFVNVFKAQLDTICLTIDNLYSGMVAKTEIILGGGG